MGKTRRKVRVTFTSGSITHFGGLLLLHLFLQRLGLRRALTRLLRARERNSQYTMGDLTLAVLYPIVLGLGRLETSRLLRDNSVFQDLTGLRPYPDPQTLRRFLSRFGLKALPAFLTLHNQWRQQLVRQGTVTFDLDSTVLTVYGKQEKAAVGFNPKKRGRPSFQPLLCFEGHTGLCWDAEWLPGNANPMALAIPVLTRAWATLPSRVQRVGVRADGAFFDQKLCAWLEERHARYAIVARISEDLKGHLLGLRYHHYASGLEAAAFPYRPSTWQQARRFVVIRRPIPEEPSAQLHLFSMKGYSYQVVVTNQTLLPLNAWKWYNGRATAELVIRELKEGCAVTKIPRHDWAANLAYFQLVLFAYNLLLGFRQRHLPRRWRRITVQTLRQRLLWIPAVLVRPQGQPTLKLPRSYPHREEFLNVLRALERAPRRRWRSRRSRGT